MVDVSLPELPDFSREDFDRISDSYKRYIVRPLNAFGLGGFVFDIERDTQLQQSTDITDHFVEDNSVIQDHIAIRPRYITLRSIAGENVYIAEDQELMSDVRKVAQKLITLGSYLPVLADAAEQAIDVFEGGSIEGVIDNVSLDDIQNLWQLTQNLNPVAARQQQAYTYFNALLEERVLVGMQTPFGFFPDMAIQSVIAEQPEETAFISNFTITLKQVRTASLQTTPFDADEHQNRGASQRAPETPINKTNNNSVLFDLLDFDEFVLESPNSTPFNQ